MMKPIKTIALLSTTLVATCHSLSDSTVTPSVTDPTTKVMFQGNLSNNVESFLNIRFGHDTSGANRFAHPAPFAYPPGTVVDASAPGAACPQQRVPVEGFSIFANVTNISEDCLTLRIDRPANTTAKDKLPVMVWIFGGGDAIGQIYDPIYDPTGLVLGSAAQGTPIIYVAMNYRLGVFGFAATPALAASNSLNAGLLDQRLALDWVQEHISLFGGDPEQVTIFGESDGAQSVGLHITAYGGQSNTKPPFYRAIMESGAATENTGVVLNQTAEHTAHVVAAVNCTSPTLNFTHELACMRALPLHTLLHAAVTYEFELSNFGFEVFDPVAPSPFIPDAPSKLLRTSRFAHDISLITGWNENDGSLFVPSNLTDEADTLAWLQASFPPLGPEHTLTLLALYPTHAFPDDAAANVSAQYFRAAQMERDQSFTCPSLLMAQSMARYSTHETTSTYFYALNATMFAPFFAQAGVGYYGVSHFSDIPFVFDEAPGAPASTVQLAGQISGAWAAFATHGDPSAPVVGRTLGAWSEAVKTGTAEDGPYGLKVFGGPRAGEMVIGEALNPKDGRALYDEDVVRRCAFWNSEEVLQRLGV